MTAPAMTYRNTPLVAVAGVPADGRRWRRSVVLATGVWAAAAGPRAAAQLQQHVGLTRASSTVVHAFPPERVLTVLDEVTGVPDVELAGAKLAAAACGDLWLFLAECRVLWAQRADLVGQS
jgi:hypothetical protein